MASISPASSPLRVAGSDSWVMVQIPTVPRNASSDLGHAVIPPAYVALARFVEERPKWRRGLFRRGDQRVPGLLGADGAAARPQGHLRPVGLSRGLGGGGVGRPGRRARGGAVGGARMVGLAPDRLAVTARLEPRRRGPRGELGARRDLVSRAYDRAPRHAWGPVSPPRDPSTR